VAATTALAAWMGVPLVLILLAAAAAGTSVFRDPQ
jgi:hypothetical protein